MLVPDTKFHLFHPRIGAVNLQTCDLSAHEVLAQATVQWCHVLDTQLFHQTQNVQLMKKKIYQTKTGLTE